MGVSADNRTQKFFIVVYEITFKICQFILLAAFLNYVFQIIRLFPILTNIIFCTMTSEALKIIGIVRLLYICRIFVSLDLINFSIQTESGKATDTSSLFMAMKEDEKMDDFLKYKKMEKQLKHLSVLEQYIKMDMRNLEKELLHAQEEV